MRLSEEEATRATKGIKGVILHAPLAASEACPNDPQESGEIIHRRKAADADHRGGADERRETAPPRRSPRDRPRLDRA